MTALSLLLKAAGKRPWTAQEAEGWEDEHRESGDPEYYCWQTLLPDDRFPKPCEVADECDGHPNPDYEAFHEIEGPRYIQGDDYHFWNKADAHLAAIAVNHFEALVGALARLQSNATECCCMRCAFHEQQMRDAEELLAAIETDATVLDGKAIASARACIEEIKMKEKESGKT